MKTVFSVLAGSYTHVYGFLAHPLSSDVLSLQRTSGVRPVPEYCSFFPFTFQFPEGEESENNILSVFKTILLFEGVWQGYCLYRNNMLKNLWGFDIVLEQ